ncbi:sensor histidine kinase [Lacticaseibacillus songhuajiangensis]|jgi:NarL family two-component system sensor histidine kinase LiaS|uniref:sensor histidine kinase n=1 Tax=Lacticaseibacillus songhuajiangensis TaxID=1296539 RepID=UPI000F775B83|nr:sensor histidine kinase [Lacticaseibacillus songhuajiangensis]
MRKRTYLGIFSSIAIATLAFEFALVWMIEGSRNPQNWLGSLTRYYYGFPVAGYAVLGAVTTGIIAFLIIYVVMHRLSREITSRLSTLSGNELANLSFSDSRTQHAVGRENAVMLESLRRKVLRLQQEITRYSAKPEMVGGESKEQILVDERHRIARELHDSVSQQLFAAMMMLSALRSVAKKGGDEKVQTQVRTIERVINSAQSEMRALLLHLRPTNLAGKHLREGIIGLLKELQTKINIRITWELAPVELPAATEDNLFRIVQELLSNTLRHADAEELEVYLAESAGTVILRVIDDGVGFDTSQASAAGSYGLQNIRERAAAIGGTARVVSFPNQGTSVEIRVPITKEETNND